MEKKRIQVTEYILNLTALREHFHIGPEPMNSGLNLGDSVDEGAMTGDGAPADDEQMEADEEDDDDLEPEELGRRMHARGDAPPSPHAQNSHIRRGYDEAVRAAATATAAANSPAAVRLTAMGFTVGSVPLSGNEMSQEAIDQARADRQERQQQQAKGKQRASASVAGEPPVKKPRHGTTTVGGASSSVALVHKGRVLLTRDTRKGVPRGAFGRRKHMHFPGQNRAAGAVRALDRAGAGPSGGAGGAGPSGVAGGVAGADALNLGGVEVAGEE